MLMNKAFKLHQKEYGTCRSAGKKSNSVICLFSL